MATKPLDAELAGYGQVGSVKGALSCEVASWCSRRTRRQPTSCVGESADVASLRYLGSEFQVAYRIPKMERLVPHVSVGGNFIDAAIQLSGRRWCGAWTKPGSGTRAVPSP